MKALVVNQCVLTAGWHKGEHQTFEATDGKEIQDVVTESSSQLKVELKATHLKIAI